MIIENNLTVVYRHPDLLYAQKMIKERKQAIEGYKNGYGCGYGWGGNRSGNVSPLSYYIHQSSVKNRNKYRNRSKNRNRNNGVNSVHVDRNTKDITKNMKKWEINKRTK